MKLLNPKTRIVTPVNWTTPAKSEWKSAINWGKIGAIANGPKVWANVTNVTDAMAESFHIGLQFYIHMLLDMGMPTLKPRKPIKWEFAAYQRIMNICRWLWNQYDMATLASRKMLSTNIFHDLRAGYCFCLKLYFELMEGLSRTNRLARSHVPLCCISFRSNRDAHLQPRWYSSPSFSERFEEYAWQCCQRGSLVTARERATDVGETTSGLCIAWSGWYPLVALDRLDGSITHWLDVWTLHTIDIDPQSHTMIASAKHVALENCKSQPGSLQYIAMACHTASVSLRPTGSRCRFRVAFREHEHIPFGVIFCSPLIRRHQMDSTCTTICSHYFNLTG